MSQTHYYYAIKRKAAERITELTWQQFLDKFGWGGPLNEWGEIGSFLAYGLDRPELPERPTLKEIAPILRWKIRRTLPRMSPQYLILLNLSYQMGGRSFVTADIDAEDQEDDSEALVVAAMSGFTCGDIDARTLWSVLTLHEELFPDFFDRWHLALTETDRRRIKAVKRTFGRSRPIFDWQTRSAVNDGHTVLHEDDTKRFTHFVQLAWRENWHVCAATPGGRLPRFRNFELARTLHAATPALRGCCLVRYWGA